MREWQDDEHLRELVESTRVSSSGPFNPRLPSIFEPPSATTDAVWVSATSDVSDRISTARRTHDWVALGIDAVARLVNQVWARGAVPSALNATLLLMNPALEVREGVVIGITRGCRADAVAIAGLQSVATGATGDDHDARLSLIGVATHSTLLDGSKVRSGDVLVGLAAQGLHSDGHQKAWAIADAQGWAIGDEVPGTGATLTTLMNARHKTYLGTLQRPMAQQWLHALVPVGRGGLTGSLEQWLSPTFTFKLEYGVWNLPPLQQALQRASGMSLETFAHEFNAGLGMVAVLPAERAPELIDWIRVWNEGAWVIGTID